MPSKTKQSPIAALGAFTLDLPPTYNAADALSFHGRDKEAVSEAVTARGFRKAVLLDDVPTVLEFVLERGASAAHCTMSVDGAITEPIRRQAEEVSGNLLGLRLDPTVFAQFVADDLVFGPLTKTQADLRIVQSSSIFEALTWAVMGQQINVSFAVSLRRTFIQLAGRLHSSGLRCYPSPEDAVQIPLEALTARQYSRSKAETVLRLATLIAHGELDLVESVSNPLEAICASLLAVKGIGPWTVNYALLRGFGHADCSLHGDVAVRSAIAKLWRHETRPDMAAVEVFLAQYSPHRTMAAAHLWASLNPKNGY